MIKTITQGVTGLSGVVPNFIFIEFEQGTSLMDALAVGALNSAKQYNGIQLSPNQFIFFKTDDGVATGSVLVSGDNYSISLQSGAYAVIAAGTYTTTGGSATEDIPVPGALASDIASVEMKTQGATPRTILTRAAAVDEITVVYSGDPSTDHVVTWSLLRAVQYD